MTLSGLVFFQAIGCFPVSVSLVRFAWRAFEGQEQPLQSVGSDVFFTLCLSTGGSHANLPIYPYTA